MTAGPNAQDILTALQKSGYLMEQEVATELEALGLHVWTNWAFEDSDEGKSREVDIRALKQVAVNESKNLSAFVEFIVECKNTANPYVFVGRPKNATDEYNVPQEFIFPVSKYREHVGSNAVREKDPYFHLGFDKVCHYAVDRQKAVQFCRINRKGKAWEANHGGLYDSMFLPLAKALHARKSEVNPQRFNRSAPVLWFFVPMVVTSGDIYYVDSSDAKPSTQSRDFANFVREIRSGQLQGIFSVDFVRQNRIKQFYRDCVQSVVDRMTELTMHQADFMLTRDIPWRG